MHRIETWVLLADASRARVLRAPERAVDGMHAPIETIFEAGAEHLRLGDIMADAPGRSFQSVGTSRSAMEYHSDPVRDETRRFAFSLLSDLETRFAAGEFEQLVICAPPRMLGALRDAMPDRIAAAVRSEIAKDFTKLPERELRRLLERLE
jgi:protein required for attachment to host cells